MCRQNMIRYGPRAKRQREQLCWARAQIEHTSMLRLTEREKKRVRAQWMREKETR
jgi:hypothetical protein